MKPLLVSVPEYGEDSMSSAATLLTPLRRMPTPKGDVLHALKANDPGFDGFGEAYFSQVLSGSVKGWKRHSRMVLNLVCIVGAVRVVVYHDEQRVQDVILSPDDYSTYQRLTILPGCYVGFAGVADGTSTLLNIASIPHDPTEADTRSLEAFEWPI